MRLQVKRDIGGKPVEQIFHVKWLAYGKSEAVMYSVGADPVDLPDEVGRYFVRNYAQYIEIAPAEPPVAEVEPPIVKSPRVGRPKKT